MSPIAHIEDFESTPMSRRARTLFIALAIAFAALWLAAWIGMTRPLLQAMKHARKQGVALMHKGAPGHEGRSHRLECQPGPR